MLIPRESNSSGSAPAYQFVNVGCGTSLLSSQWCNTDCLPLPGVDIILDVRQPWPWHQTLTHVYAKNLLEILHLEDAVLFLREAHQALSDGGRIRLITPSLEWIVKTCSELNLESHPELAMHDTRWINNAFRSGNRQFLYSKTMLQTLLQRLGFTEITFHRLGESQDPRFNNLSFEVEQQSFIAPDAEWVIEAKKGLMDVDELIDFLEDITSL